MVGVDPAHQGRGLGGPVTRLGLAHLARAGLREVELYVDGDNTAARRTYERLGFTDAAERFRAIGAIERHALREHRLHDVVPGQRDFLAQLFAQIDLLLEAHERFELRA